MAKRLNTRRKLSAGAAVVTGLGMVGIAAATPAQADINGSLEYQCSVSDLGIDFEDPWTVDLTVGVEEQYDQGATIPAPAISADVTPGADAQQRMRDLGIQTLEGTADTTYSFGDTERTAELTVPETAVSDDPTDFVTTSATGSGSEETAPSEDTTVPVTAGDFTAALTTDTGFVLNLACTAPEANSIGEVTIGEATDPEPTDPEPTDPEPTDPEPTDPEPTDPEPTDPEPTDPEPTEDPTEDPTDDPTEDPTDDETDEPAETNDWFKEPKSLPITEDQKHFTVEGEAAQDGVIQVVLLDGDKKELRTDEWNVTEGSNSKNFAFEEGTDYVRVISQDCVDANGDDEEVVGSGCNVEYYAPWVNPDNGDGDDSGSGDDSDAGEGDDAGSGDAEQGSGPEVPSVVQTDGFQRSAAPQQDNTLALALGGLLLAGAGAGTIVVARRRAVSQH